MFCQSRLNLTIATRRQNQLNLTITLQLMVSLSIFVLRVIVSINLKLIFHQLKHETYLAIGTFSTQIYAIIKDINKSLIIPQSAILRLIIETLKSLSLFRR